MNLNFDKSQKLVLILIIFGIISRIIPHPPNFSPVTAIALFGGLNFSNKKIIAGENSAPGVISLIASCEDEKIKDKMKLNKDSNILLIGCEGDTDQEMYQKLINQ